MASAVWLFIIISKISTIWSNGYALEESRGALQGKKTYATWQEGLLQIFEAVYENKPFIINAYNAVSREQIENFLFQLTHDLIMSVVEEQAKSTSLHRNRKSFIADFYKYSFVGIMLDWIRTGNQNRKTGRCRWQNAYQNIVGSGLASLAAACFLVRDAQMKGDHIHILEAMDIAGGACDGIFDPSSGYMMRGGREMENHFECLWDLFHSIPSIETPGVSVLDEYYWLNKHDPNYSLCRATVNRGEDAHTDGKFNSARRAVWKS